MTRLFTFVYIAKAAGRQRVTRGSLALFYGSHCRKKFGRILAVRSTIDQTLVESGKFESGGYLSSPKRGARPNK